MDNDERFALYLKARAGTARMRRHTYEANPPRGLRPFGVTQLLVSPDVQRFVPGEVHSYRGPGTFHANCDGCRRTAESRRIRSNPFLGEAPND